jgi:flavin reductase (DIM6/NTAB) family NADH-FMN oxidoreductase RutF
MLAESSSKHFYEPAKGHGLAHDPLNAIIGPRPIGWISSSGKDGTINLAPYSFFNAFSYTPPIIGFSSIGEKDSLRNARETGQFVWNLVTRELAAKMNETCAFVPYGVNEFELAGLKMSASNIVASPCVAESRVNSHRAKTGDETVEVRSNGEAYQSIRDLRVHRQGDRSPTYPAGGWRARVRPWIRRAIQRALSALPDHGRARAEARGQSSVARSDCERP